MPDPFFVKNFQGQDKITAKTGQNRGMSLSPTVFKLGRSNFYSRKSLGTGILIGAGSQKF